MTAAGIAVFVLGLALIVAVALFVAAPLFVAAAPMVAVERDGHERWERQKRQALGAIREAELDHQMGKLSDEDLATMRARFEAQAFEAMAALDEEERRR